MPRGPFNVRRRLRPGELPRRYLRRHDSEGAADLRDADDGMYLDIDDYWDPWNQATDLDFELEQLWHDIVDIAFGAPLDLSRIAVAGAGPDAMPAELPPSIDRDRLVDELHERIAQVTSRDRQAQFLARASFEIPREQLRLAGRREPALLHWIGQHRGPSTMLAVLAPLWVRPVETWSAPRDADDEAITRSLIAHLFGRYPIPTALFSPWCGSAAPSLKWASWLVLIGGGASLRRAAPRFGWQISSQLVHHLFGAPPELEPIEAIVWAELTQRGGTDRELERLRRHQAFIYDTTEPPEPDAASTRERFRAFWLATVDWLVRHRDALTDETSDQVLTWALHRHTEDVARNVPPHECFTWRGRAPAAAREAAREYERQLQMVRRGWRPDLRWKARGWDWDYIDDDRSWAIRELTTSRELDAESAAMHHCVFGYASRCAAGWSAIFSLQLAGERAVTIELEPRTRRVVQARGARNRECRSDEQAIIARWLAALAARASGATRDLVDPGSGV